jgi:hypothetical protein
LCRHWGAAQKYEDENYRPLHNGADTLWLFHVMKAIIYYLSFDWKGIGESAEMRHVKQQLIYRRRAYQKRRNGG